MIRGLLDLYRASGRWVPALLILLVWVGFVCAAPGPSGSNAAASFAGVLIASIWVPASLGDFDDPPHRDLLAAAVGSSARQHRGRALASLTMLVAAVPVTALCVLSGTEQPRTPGPSSLACGAVTVAAVLIGVGVGTWLHRPVLANRALVVLAAVAATIVIMVLPPLQAALRAVSDGLAGPGVALLLVAAGWGVASVGASSLVAMVRAR